MFKELKDKILKIKEINCAESNYKAFGFMIYQVYIFTHLHNQEDNCKCSFELHQYTILHSGICANQNYTISNFIKIINNQL